jgi:hypothetical protein
MQGKNLYWLPDCFQALMDPIKAPILMCSAAFRFYAKSVADSHLLPFLLPLILLLPSVEFIITMPMPTLVLFLRCKCRCH